MNCPHCHSELRRHAADAGASKAGAYHCDGCGCCFTDGKTPREGTPVCALAEMAADEADEAEDEEDAEAPARPRGRPRTAQ